jgi:bile acid:Na+ symporter, BASS family
MLQRYLVVWLVVSSVAAFFWPAIVGPSLDPWLITGDEGRVVSRLPLGAIVALTMFAIGALLPREEVARVLQRWPLVIGGTTTQYIAMPLLAFLLANLIPLPKDLFIGVVLVGCVPGAMASNVLTLAARGNVSYSVSLTTAATLLSPLVVPLALALTLSTTAAINPLAVSLQLLREVVGPVVAGHLLSRCWETFARAMAVIGSSIANLAILWIIATVVALNRDRLADISASVLAVLVFLNLGGYTAGHLGARLLRIDEGMRRALILEVGMQNAGVGTVLAVSLFPDHPAVAIPTAAYTFGCMLSGSVLAWWFSRQTPAGDPSAAETDPPIPT